MGSIFDALPGVVMPIRDIPATLSRMWQVERVEGREAPSEFRASQMNLILHFGVATPPEEARAQFDTAIRFAQVYPCRIIVLCPESDLQPMGGMTGKLFSQCYIGSSQRKMCCCEALVLGYPVDENTFVENQVSVWVEGDLPIHHWFHRVPSERVQEAYLNHLKCCRRVVFDSSVEGPAFDRVPWPRRDSVADLAYARLLPVRQMIGQYLSAFEPAVLAEGLASVECRHAEGFGGEAVALLDWQEQALLECARLSGASYEVNFRARRAVENPANALEVVWSYTNGRRFSCGLNFAAGTATMEADFGKGPSRFPVEVRPLPPERALAEALFFSSSLVRVGKPDYASFHTPI